MMNLVLKALRQTFCYTSEPYPKDGRIEKDDKIPECKISMHQYAQE